MHPVFTNIFNNGNKIEVDMYELIKNELIKIFYRRKTYILLFVSIIYIFSYNYVQKITNLNIDIKHQYLNAYSNDILLLKNYNNLNITEEYYNIIERMHLDKYAIENNIEYNILVNSENDKIPLPEDARILLMRIYNNFEIIIVLIIIYLSSIMILEEYSTGTIKYLLIKPYSRFHILVSKIIAIILTIILLILFFTLFQYIIGGILFGFDSYTLEAIIYNNSIHNIETMNLFKYMVIISISKFPMYLLLILICFLIGVITTNAYLNILITFLVYLISKINLSFFSITKYIFIYNWDLSTHLSNYYNFARALLISLISIVCILNIFIFIFRNKDV